jgi:hypothetical protein
MANHAETALEFLRKLCRVEIELNKVRLQQREQELEEQGGKSSAFHNDAAYEMYFTRSIVYEEIKRCIKE